MLSALSLKIWTGMLSSGWVFWSYFLVLGLGHSLGDYQLRISLQVGLGTTLLRRYC
ncbi:hypothetical protein BJX65DRAFT_280738 [Aspergillus insuetus]